MNKTSLLAAVTVAVHLKGAATNLNYPLTNLNTVLISSLGPNPSPTHPSTTCRGILLLSSPRGNQAHEQDKAESLVEQRA